MATRKLAVAMTSPGTTVRVAFDLTTAQVLALRRRAAKRGMALSSYVAALVLAAATEGDVEERVREVVFSDECIATWDMDHVDREALVKALVTALEPR